MMKGQKNCITDVSGVKVGHVTLYEKVNSEDTICTGVTAIIPHKGNLFTEKVHAASYIINGYGKTAGLIQVNELGLIESPIMLTNTFSVGPVLQGTLEYMLKQNDQIGDQMSSINIVVGECNDSYLNSMRIPAIKPEHAIKAIKMATNERTEEGAVGAGKGMVCFGYKGGIGTASRVITYDNHEYTLGCLVLSNFGKREEALFNDFNPLKHETSDGSIMIVIATDAPLLNRQLQRIAKRSAAGLGRTGSHFSHGSGDIVIAFSTANLYEHQSKNVEHTVTYIRDDHPIFNLFFKAATEITEEAILSSLKNAVTTKGRKGRVIERIPK